MSTLESYRNYSNNPSGFSISAYSREDLLEGLGLLEFKLTPEERGDFRRVYWKGIFRGITVIVYQTEQ